MLNYPLTLRFDLLTVSGIGQHVRVTDSSRQEVAVAEQESLRVFPKWTVSVAGQPLYVLEPGIRSMRITRLEDRETWWLERDGIILATYRLRSATDEATLLIRPMNTLLFSAGCMSIFVYGLIGLALFFVLFSFRSPAREQALAILIVLLFATWFVRQRFMSLRYAAEIPPGDRVLDIRRAGLGPTLSVNLGADASTPSQATVLPALIAFAILQR